MVIRSQIDCARHFLDDLGYPGNRYTFTIIDRNFVEMSCDDMFFFQLSIPKLCRRNFRVHSKVPKS